MGVLEKKFNKTPEQTQHLANELHKAFPEAWVEGYKTLEGGLTNDPKDRHVLAAAIKSGAQTIVTFNLKDFQSKCIDPFDIEVIHPDHFLVNQAGYVLDSGGYGLTAFRGLAHWTFVALPAAGRRRPARSRGTAPPWLLP